MPGPSSPVAVFDNYWAPTLAFAKSLGSRRVPLHFYGSGAGRWSRYCKQRRSCPPVEDAAAFLPWLQAKVRSGEISRVAPTTDLIAYYVSRIRDEFSPDVRRSILPLEEIETCLIKTRFADACAQLGLAEATTASPRTLNEAEKAAAEIGLPIIIKPKSHLVVGTADRGHLVRNASELRAKFRQYSVIKGQDEMAERYPELLLPLMQRYVPSARDRVYSVSGCKDPERGIVASSLSYKREQWPPVVGTSTVQISCNDERILRAGLQIVDRLISRGIFELELLADGDNLLPIDLNPRAFGFIELDIALGRDLPWLWYRSTFEPVEPLEQSLPTIALEARNSFLYHLRRLVGGPARKASPAIDRRDPQRPRASITMLGHWSDPVPVIVSYLHLLRHPRSLVIDQFRKEEPDVFDAQCTNADSSFT